MFNHLKTDGIMKRFFLLIYLSQISVFAFSQWTAISSGTNNYLYSVYFTDANTGYVVGVGTILKTSNGGETWSALSSATDKNLFEVHFPDPNIGYVVGEKGTILQSINGL